MFRRLKTVVAILLLVMVTSVIGSIAIAQVDSVHVGGVALVEPSPPNILNQIAATLAALTPIMAILVSFGLATKYLPFMAKVPNLLIPFLNAVISFLVVFNGPAPANAGIFGDIVHGLSFPAKAAGSLFLSGVARLIYETYIRGIMEKLGQFGAGLTPAQQAAKAKVLGV